MRRRKVAEYLLESGSVNTFKRPDLGLDLQVRHTEHWAGGLVVRPGESDEETFILVTGKFPVFHVRGYMLGYDAKLQKYNDHFHEKRMTGPEAFLVPQSALKPNILDLKE